MRRELQNPYVVALLKAVEKSYDFSRRYFKVGFTGNRYCEADYL